MRVAVNGVEISEPAVLGEMQHHPAANAAGAMEQAARALAVRELLLQEARRLGLDTGAEENETAEESVIRRLIAREVASPEADETACRRYYDNNRRKFLSPDAFDARHILYAAAPSDAEARAQARVSAEGALARVLAAPGSFEAIARAESDCPSKTQGGRLGPIQRGGADETFETYLMSLGEGETCAQVVETRYGFHLIRLDRRIAGRELPFDSVRERIAAYLEESAWRRAVHQYVAILAGRARIEGVVLDAATTPLVQ